MSSSAAMPAESAQQNNFNPSWMRSAFHGGGVNSSPRVSTNEEEDHPVSAPVFVKNRYGREDLLALVGQDSHPPEGLSDCPFYLTEPANPIVCYPLTDTEQRLQQNVNSSKAMSSLTQAERASVAAGGVYGSPNGVSAGQARGGGGGGWTPVKSTNNWSRNSASNTSGGSNMRGASRPYVARGGARPPSDSPGEEAITTPYGQRFVKAGGRGTPTTARGGSTTANSFNSRAQGLYDPRDPKDRPRNRLRSTSDEGGADSSNGNEGGWTTVSKPVWGGANKEPRQGNNQSAWNREKETPWGGLSRENSAPSGNAAWRSEAANGPLPEWMDDGDKTEEAGEPVAAVPGSFDERGRYEQRNQKNAQAGVPQHGQGHVARQLSDEAAAPPQPSTFPWMQEQANQDQARRQEQPAAVSSEEIRLAAEAKLIFDRLLAEKQGAQGAYGAPSLNMPPVMQRPPPPPAMVPVEFLYLDPTKQERGPFRKEQMDAWFKTGYFSDELEVRRRTDNVWKSLGELKRINGPNTPFDYKEVLPVIPPVSYPSYGNIFGGGGNVWNDASAGMNPGLYGQAHGQQNVHDPLAMERKRMEEEQRRILDEELKKRDRDMMEAMEKLKQAEEQAKAIRERERALAEKEEEIERRLNEERARREMEQLDLAEKVRRLEAERETRLQEEREKAQAKKAEEAQRNALKKKEEAEKKRKEKEMEEAKQREEEARRRRAEDAAEEHKRQLKQRAEEDAAKIRQIAAMEAAKKEEERKRSAAAVAKKAAESYDIEEAFEAASKPKQTSSSESDGWNVASSKKSTAPKVAPWSAAANSAPREKTLKEIQEEEERQQKAEAKEQRRIKKEDSSTSLQSAGTWTNASQRISWNQPQPSPQVAAVVGGKSAWGGAGLEQKPAAPSPFWDGPSLQASNRQVAPVAKKAAQPKPAVAKQTAPAKQTKANNKNEKAGADPFTSWVVQRLKQLSSSVDADVLASFLESVENPNEVEDYVEGYLGSTKAAKEFVNDFLKKRCEMRKRNKGTDKDDLSSARVAPAAGTASGSGQGKKKKGKGARLVVDGSCLGFRPAADPNRLNQGEIETVPLAAGQKR